jgi:TP901 family phage tail tape measure protein
MPALDEVIIRIRAMGGKAAATEMGAAEGAMGKLSGLAGKAFGAAGVAFGIEKAVTASADFHAQMERIQTQAHQSTGEVTAMTKAAMDQAVHLGTSPQGLATSLYHLESAGLHGKDALDGMKIAAEGAKVGGADLTDTTTAMAAVMVAGFKGINNVGEAMGALNATVGAGDMTFQDLNDSLNTGILATFKSAGLQVKDFGAAMATLGDNNIRGSHAAVMLRQSVIGMIGPSKIAQGELKKMGMGPTQLAEDLRKPNGFLVAMQDMHEHLKNLAPVAREAAVVKIFGRQDAGPMLTFLNQMDRLKQKYEDVGKGQGSFQKDWQNTQKTLKFVLDQLKTLAEVALIKLGDAISLVVGPIQDFIKALERGKLWAQALAVTLGSVLAVVIGKVLVDAVISLGKAMIAFIVENPILFAIAAIITIIVLLILHWKEVKKVATDVWKAIWGAMKDVWAWMKGAWKDALNWLSGAWRTMKGAALDAWHWIKGAAHDVWAWIKGNWPILAGVLFGPFGYVVGWVVTHWKQVKGALKDVWDWIKSAWHTLSDILTWPFREAVKIIKNDINLMIDGLNALIGGFNKVFGPHKIDVGPFHAKTPGLHLGTIAHVAATGGFTPTGGMFDVGERGRERIMLPPASLIVPNAFANTGLAGGGQPIKNHVTLKIGQKEFARAISWTTAKELATH